MSTTTIRRRAPRAMPHEPAAPDELAHRLRLSDDPRDQLVLIAEHERASLQRSVRAFVDPATAEDIVSEVIVRYLERQRTTPEWTYGDPDGYQRLRAGLRRSVRNLAIDHLRRGRQITGFLDASVHAVAESATTTDPISALDAAALYDAFRRLDRRDAEVLRIKLVDGGTFRALADHLGFRSLNAAHKHYMRAIRSAQAALDRYGAGGYCRQYGPYLALLHQERGAPHTEKPLTALIGEQRAREVRLHVDGDPSIPEDMGCHACQQAARRQSAAVAALLPPSAAGGHDAGLPSAIGHVGRQVYDWLGSWLGVAQGAMTVHPTGVGFTARTAAGLVAATVVLATPVAVTQLAGDRSAGPPRHAAAGPPRVVPSPSGRAPALTRPRAGRPGPAAAASLPARPPVGTGGGRPARARGGGARTPSAEAGPDREFTPGP